MKTRKTKLTQRMSDGEEASMAQTTQPKCTSVGIQPPTGLDLSTKKKKDNWRIYKQQWNNYGVIAELEKQSEEYKIAMFLYSIGPDAVRVYNAFDMTDDQRKSLKSIVEAFDTYADGSTNETYERYRFNNRNQKENETIDEYITELRSLAQTCGFCNCLKDSLIRDRMVLGIRDTQTRKRLLQETKLTLQKCINICQGSEATANQMKELKVQDEEEIHGVFNSNRRAEKKRGKRYPMEMTHYKSQQDERECRYCGQRHKQDKMKCPAWGKECRKCGKKNHFARKCMSTREKMNQVDDYTSSSSETEYIDSITVKHEPVNAIKNNRDTAKEIYAEMLIDDQSVNFHIDCGATVNVLPKKFVKTRELQPTSKVLQMWNKTEIRPVGATRKKIRNPRNGKKYSVEFMVVEEPLTPLLGATAVQRMNIIEVKVENFKRISSVDCEGGKSGREEVLNQYSDVFEGELGTLPGTQHLEVDQEIQPRAVPPRKVPIAMKPKLKNELERLQTLGVIAPVDKPTEWVSNLALATKKSGQLRVCIDPKYLNQALRRERYPLPVIEDILPELSSAKVFTTVDARNGYWHVVLDEESSLLTTFDTPIGRYRWLRLPFGLCVASEIFQKRLHQALEGLEGIFSIADDIIVYGAGDTVEEANADHDRKFEALLQRCRAKGIKLNQEKLKFKQTEITYLGHLVTNEGLKPDTGKVEAVKKMPKPDDAKAVRRFCGFVTYLARFLPRLSDVMEPLRQLTRKDAEWKWTDHHDKAFFQTKQLVVEATLLKFYDPQKELVVQCDASEKGIGVALLQEGQPIAFASRALTDAETRYAQIEKEMLAVVYAVEKFNQYTYGRHVSIESDHRPLQAIMKKPLHSAPKRLQGMMLRLQKYDVNITFKPGHQMYLADTLSRASLSTTEENLQKDFEQVAAVKLLPMSEARQENLKQQTQADPVLQQLKSVILKGWPSEKHSLSDDVKPFFSVRDELAVYDGLIFKGERIVVPKSLRSSMKKEIHSSHIGRDGCLRRARESMYWPGMNSELKEYVAQCEICRQYETRQQRETLMCHELTERPWEKVGTDIFTYDGNDFLVTVDYFSNYWEVDKLQDTKATTTVRKLKAQFARHGIPDVVISDNGPQFSSEKFNQFAEVWGFEHRTSSPGHPQANGKAESAVKTAKKLLRKAKTAGEDPYLAMLAHRNTPTEGTETSPAQRLMGRRTKTLLPTTANLLRPHGTDVRRIRQQAARKQQQQEKHYNKKAKNLAPLTEGDGIRMRPFALNKRSWKKGIVSRRLDERSYQVQTSNGSYRRNRVDLKKTREQTESVIPDDSTDTTQNEIADTALENQPQISGDQPQDVESSRQRPMRIRREPLYLNDYIR